MLDASDERLLRLKLYGIDSAQLGEADKRWFHTKATDLVAWTYRDRYIAAALIELDRVRQLKEPARKAFRKRK